MTARHVGISYRSAWQLAPTYIAIHGTWEKAGLPTNKMRSQEPWHVGISYRSDWQLAPTCIAMDLWDLEESWPTYQQNEKSRAMPFN